MEEVLLILTYVPNSRNLKCRSVTVHGLTEIEKEVLNNKILQGWTYWDSVTKSKLSLNGQSRLIMMILSLIPVSTLIPDNVKWLKMSGVKHLLIQSSAKY